MTPLRPLVQLLMTVPAVNDVPASNESGERARKPERREHSFRGPFWSAPESSSQTA